MGFVYDIVACAEQQARAGTVCALGLALSETLERALLVTNETPQAARRCVKTRQGRTDLCTQEDRIPCERTDKRPGCVGHLADVLTCAHVTKQIPFGLLMTGAQGYEVKQSGRSEERRVGKECLE